MFRMRKYVQIALGLIITSLCLFPVSLRILPTANSKMIMAVIGLFILAYNAYNYYATISRTLCGLSIWAALLSLSCLTSVIVNNSTDYSFATYIVTMWVWFAAGYVVCVCIKYIHGYIDISLVSNYVIAVCVLQCISAVLIDSVPAMGNFVNTYWTFGDLPVKYERLYGFGASFDVAGIRFSCALILNANMIVKRSCQGYTTWLYWLTFLILLIIGNMIARTTLVGVCLSLLYIFVYLLYSKDKNINVKWTFAQLAILCICAILICVSLYHTNEGFQHHIRFAFEMFFNYFERGVFETGSTNTLLEMYSQVPETFKTWIIGDGYLLSPTNIDPYYVGDAPDSEYYMGTDVGYFRLIFYFGLSGLCIYICMLLYATLEGIRKFPQDSLIFVFIFIVNMVVWFKVGTDVFVFYAILHNVDRECRAK